jgi:hypothetical protein
MVLLDAGWATGHWLSARLDVVGGAAGCGAQSASVCALNHLQLLNLLHQTYQIDGNPRLLLQPAWDDF